MSRQWYPHFPGDYMRDTGHLTIVEDGAYRRLLDHYYSSGEPLTSDKSKLYRICRAFEDYEQEAVSCVIDQFFELENGLYHNQRADKEIAKSEAVSKKNSDNAAKRWEKERNASAVPPHMRAQCLNHASTTTTTTTSITTPEPQPQKKRKRCEYTSEFESWWHMYSVGSKAQAFRAWKKQSPTDEEILTIIESVPAYKAYCKSAERSLKDGQGWINGRFWETEWTHAAQGTSPHGNTNQPKFDRLHVSASKNFADYRL